MNEPQTNNYEFGEFRLCSVKRLLTKGDGEIIPLTPKVFELLLYLVRNNGRTLEKDELMRGVWTDTIVEESNLSQNISILRRVLGEKRDEHQFIVTVPGKGYKFVAPVSPKSEVQNPKPLEIPDAGLPIQDSSAADQKPKFKNRNRKNYVFAALVLLIAVGAAFYFWQMPAKSVSSIKTVAVLPFKPLVADNRDEALEMGMADTLIARLGGNREIIVRPLSSVRRFGNLEQDAQTAGRELGVDSVLDGNIQHWGDKIRVNVLLIRTADGAILWNGTFDEKFTDIFVVQDTISQKVAAALALRLSSDETNRLNKRGTENVEAYRFYLQGRYHALKVTPPEIRQGIGFYQQAIAADPLYALAFAGMAQAYAALPITSDVPPNEAFPQAKAAARKALEIDPNLAEAHMILGVVDFWFDWNWSDAEAELKKAIEINPNNADAHRFYAVLLTVLGRSDEALAEMETARQSDPLSLIVNALKAQAFFYAGRDAEAIEQSNRTLEIEPNFWIAHLMLARIYIRQNKFDEAILEANKAKEFSGGNSEAVSLAAYALAKSGRRDEALMMLEALKSKSNERYVPAYNIAMIYNGLGINPEALNQLEKSFQTHDARMILLKVEPKWDNLRDEPRFMDLMQRMKFDK
ncbi:N/A [soil metagenome]|jgi:DNA-binding winged helix-turn-helix (wHTH) protein/TolB-like protein/Flp pilus assembly protein TadD